MTREPEWSPEEFELLLSRPDLEDAELEAVIQTRSAGAIGAVRSGVHAFHQDNSAGRGLLSQMMKTRLTEPQPRSFPCRLCGAL
jgi:hypothetical protein